MFSNIANISYNFSFTPSANMTINWLTDKNKLALALESRNNRIWTMKRMYLLKVNEKFYYGSLINTAENDFYHRVQRSKLREKLISTKVIGHM